MKDAKPYQNASLGQISQHFRVNRQPYQPKGHKGVDWVSKYGTWLSAPCDVLITNIIEGTNIVQSLEPLKRGYGIVMQQIANPTIYYIYWHCLPVFSVKIGDIVKQGEIVAQMGNSGFVMRGGVIVPLEDRNTPPYPGTHLHQEKFKLIDGEREYLNPIADIDWIIDVKDEIGEQISAVKVVLNKIIKIIKLWKQSKE